MRFIRDYEIQIQNPLGETITIAPPFSVKVRIKRDTLASTNKTSVTIIDLGQTSRAKLYKDRYTFTEYWQMVIKAGYDKKLITLFQGNLYEAYSYKQGPDWYTQIEAYDGQYAIKNGFTSTTIQKGTTQENVITTIIKDFPNIIKGVIGTPGEGENKRGKVLFGETKKVIDEETNGQYFIDKETFYAVGDDEVISNEIIVLDSSLLKTTPKRRDTFLDCDCLFFPEAEIGYFCKLESKFEIYNGQYKIMGFEHDFLYSGAECGDTGTKLSIYAGARNLQVVQ
jgi:hypothetical protein